MQGILISFAAGDAMGTYTPDQFVPKNEKWAGAAALAAIGTILLVSSFVSVWWGWNVYDDSNRETIVHPGGPAGGDSDGKEYLTSPDGLYEWDRQGESDNVYQLYFVVSIIVILAMALVVRSSCCFNTTSAFFRIRNNGERQGFSCYTPGNGPCTGRAHHSAGNATFDDGG